MKKYKMIALSAMVAALSLTGNAQADTPFNARQMGMAGITIGSGDFTGAQGDPALVTQSGSSDYAGFNLNAGAEVSDPNKMISAVNDAQNTINRVDAKIQAGTAQPSDGQQVITAVQNVSGRVVSANLGANTELSIPNSFVGGALFVGTNVRLGADFHYDPTDQNLIALDLLTNSSLTNLNSSVNVSGVAVTDAGIAMGHVFNPGLSLGGLRINHLDVGIAPKFQRIDLIDYSQSVANFQQSNFHLSQYRKSKTTLNADIGVTEYLGSSDQYRVGFKIQNIVPVSVTSPLGRVYHERPVPTIGAGYDNGLISAAIETDLTPRNGFGLVHSVQYSRIGVGLNAWNWAQLRLGYRVAINGGAKNVVTAGIGLSPFDVFNMDIGAEYGGSNTLGAAVQFGVKI